MQPNAFHTIRFGQRELIRTIEKDVGFEKDG